MSLQPAARRFRLQRGIAATLALGALLAGQLPGRAQVAGAGQICYAVADNNLAGEGDGGILDNDTLARFDFGTGAVDSVGTVTGPNGPITNIEAMTSRPDFDELIALNGNEVGRIDPADANFTPLGTLAPFADFDGAAIDRSSPNQTRLLAVSKDDTAARDNTLVEATLQTDGSGRTTSIGAPRTLVQIPREAFPPGTDSIDGIALEGNTLYGVANRGPDTPNSVSEQVLVIIDQSTGALTPLGTFEAENTSINDIEDISFDLFSNLLATSGSNFSRFADTAFIISLNRDRRPGQSLNSLQLDSAGRDFEASSCLPVRPESDLLAVKRITAVTRSGEETRFDEFTDQPGDTADNRLFDLTAGSLPVGRVDAPVALLPGDEVEYTVYAANPSSVGIENAVLCDPIEPPSILQSSSIEFASPTGSSNLSAGALDFAARAGFGRAPLAPADDACASVLADPQFLSGPPGPTGGLDAGAGGGVVTDEFDLGAGQVAAIRFRITVGQRNL